MSEQKIPKIFQLDADLMKLFLQNLYYSPSVLWITDFLMIMMTHNDMVTKHENVKKLVMESVSTLAKQ